MKLILTVTILLLLIGCNTPVSPSETKIILNTPGHPVFVDTLYIRVDAIK